MQSAGESNVVIAGVMTILLFGCSESGSSVSRVLVELHSDCGPNAARGIDDQREIEELLSYFPGVARKNAGAVPAGWAATGRLTIVFADGNSQTVYFHHDKGLWTEGNGDWPLRKGFAEFLDSIFGTAPAAGGTGNPGSLGTRTDIGRIGK